MTLPTDNPVWTVTLEAEPREPSLRNTMIAGTVAVLVGFGGFAGWAMTADLSSAAIAQGTVIANSHRKTISHLEGGILHELLVKEGDQVRAGQILLRMDGTQAQALLGQVENQLWTAQARVARLRAEQADQRSLAFPEDLVEAGKRSTVAADAMATEQRLFAARWDSYDGSLAINRRKIDQLREQIAALKAQASAAADRLRYTNEELGTIKALLEKGYERRPRLLEMQRLSAELKGRVGELAANEAQAEQAIAAAELEILSLKHDRRTEIADALQQTQGTLADMTERSRGATDIVQRKEVVAPQDGKVTDIRFYTPGGVIGAGAPILDLVPVDDELVVEAQVSPADIDSIRVGQVANVRLSAYKQRKVPTIDAHVMYVAADQVLDQRTGQSYFTARVKLDPVSLASLHHVELVPGMPAEVIMINAKRRAIDYFLSPITDSMRRAFREE
ncbi:HlyD family type I secretion periplasmic adaptor subunit [Skermanella pratensis]|uniref:HlyD family type I secretion periplasmic adaptor subunit n=1 Tax=Skermanella pratensis TaxID=2233999 RepID=UPI00130149F5|nr:HlyD family type I secretion periplasmic adaptor subunit [Skermanella pratensis]